MIYNLILTFLLKIMIRYGHFEMQLNPKNKNINKNKMLRERNNKRMIWLLKRYWD